MRSTFLSVLLILLFLSQGGQSLPGQARGSGGSAGQLADSSGGGRQARGNIAELRKAAEAGDLLAQNNLGVAYAFGRGVERSNEEAARWFSLSAAAGFAPAQSNLGYLYEKGLGVPQDYGAALREYRAAAESGNAQAQTRIGLFYENGWVVPVDQDEAVRRYRLAAEQGDAEGQRK